MRKQAMLIRFSTHNSHATRRVALFLADYNQYSVNHSAPIQPPPPPPQQNIRAEVSPSSKPFSQKPKKVAVHEADKYNLNQDVTIQDYDIYDNQVTTAYFWMWIICAHCYGSYTALL